MQPVADHRVLLQLFETRATSQRGDWMEKRSRRKKTLSSRLTMKSWILTDLVWRQPRGFKRAMRTRSVSVGSLEIWDYIDGRSAHLKHQSTRERANQKARTKRVEESGRNERLRTLDKPMLCMASATNGCTSNDTIPLHKPH